MACTTSYTAMNIAAEVVSQYQGKITNLKLQKVLYYIQVESLKTNGQPAFSDDIEAWKLGPVVRDIYNHFRKYIADSIPADDKDLQKAACELPDCIKKVIKKIVKKTWEMDAWDLVAKTHETSPWINYYVKDMSRIIPVNALRNCEMNI